MNQGFGKDFYRKGNSMKGSGHSLNRRTLKTEKLLSSSPSRKISSYSPLTNRKGMNQCEDLEGPEPS